ncbi:MAG: matrixin family metalloprotease [Elusimicrobia bacterium]|nr:matrixin family metalloprotease [Elusimicrobiota bacterium]
MLNLTDVCADADDSVVERCADDRDQYCCKDSHALIVMPFTAFNDLLWPENLKRKANQILGNHEITINEQYPSAEGLDPFSMLEGNFETLADACVSVNAALLSQIGNIRGKLPVVYVNYRGTFEEIDSPDYYGAYYSHTEWQSACQTAISESSRENREEEAERIHPIDLILINLANLGRREDGSEDTDHKCTNAVLAHEMGHAVSLRHAGHPTNLMYPSCDTNYTQEKLSKKQVAKFCRKRGFNRHPSLP